MVRKRDKKKKKKYNIRNKGHSSITHNPLGNEKPLFYFLPKPFDYF